MKNIDFSLVEGVSPSYDANGQRTCKVLLSCGTYVEITGLDTRRDFLKRWYSFCLGKV